MTEGSGGRTNGVFNDNSPRGGWRASWEREAKLAREAGCDEAVGARAGRKNRQRDVSRAAGAVGGAR